MKFFLELIDLMVSALPVVLAAEALQPLYHHTAIPGPVKDGNMARLGKPGPETPQIMPCLFMGLRACDGMHLVSAGIQSTGDALDISALTGCVPALIGNDHRNLLTVQAVVQLAQSLTQLLQLFFIILFRNRLVQWNLRKQRHPLKREHIL